MLIFETISGSVKPGVVLSFFPLAIFLIAGERLFARDSAFRPFFREQVAILLANAEAAAKGAETFEVELLRRTYSQGTFKYQVKCLQQLREAFAALPADAKARVSPVLEKTGCLGALQ